MTKKSQSRLQRDSYNENNTAWSDLEALYINNMRLLDVPPGMVGDFFKTEGIADFIPPGEKSKVVASLRGLHNDLTTFRGELEKIHDAHKNKTGKFNPDTDDLMLVLEIGESYYNYEVRYRALIDPTITYLLGVMQKTEKNIRTVAEAKPEVLEAAVENAQSIQDVVAKDETTQ